MNLTKEEIGWALRAGCISAAVPLIVIIMSSKNPIFLSFTFFFPLPIYLTYLSKGVRVGAIASMIGMLGSILWGSTGFVFLYATTFLSVHYFCKKALMSREANDSVEFYPEQLLVQSLGYITAGVCLIIAIFMTFMDTREFILLIEQIEKNMPALSAQQKTEMMALLKYTPAILSLYWAGMQLFNGVIAHNILKRKFKAIRPSFSLEDVAVKDTGLYLLALSGVAALVLESRYEVIALNLMFVLMFPYWLIGMSTLHVLFNTRLTHLKNLVWGVYLLILLIPFLYLVIVALGIFEPWMQLKSRIKNSATS